MKRAMLISTLSLLDISLTGAFSPYYRENVYTFLPDVSYVKTVDNPLLLGLVHQQSERAYFIGKNYNEEAPASKITFFPSHCILIEEKYISRRTINKRVFSSRKNTLLYHPVSFKRRIFPLKIPP